MREKQDNLLRWFTFLVFVFSLTKGSSTLAQERQEVYFHKRFTQRVDTSKLSLAKYVRSYEKIDSTTIRVIDYTQVNRNKYGRKKLREAIYSGLNDFLEVDQFYRHYEFLGLDSIGDFGRSQARVTNYYSDGDLRDETLLKDNRIRYIQRYDPDSQEPLLTNGNGVYKKENKDRDERYEVVYKDSLIVHSYTIRNQRKDTLFNKVTSVAKPKNGIRSFYRSMVEKLEFPKKALEAGIERSVTVQFVVDETGKLVDFEIRSRSNHFFEFENHTIETLKKLPPWLPAKLNGKAVKMPFRLPVTFALID